MLPKSHQQELSIWLELLKSFDLLFFENSNNSLEVQQSWQKIQDYLHTRIMIFNSEDLTVNNRSLFQSWQRETYRYIRLLQTDFSFYQSAKQISTKQSRFLIIKQRLNEVINLTKNYGNFQ
ncbi:heterocyst frequency control protein PatD [Geminocystis sp. NIES-3709]|uniref:heterocyst frequency control protein PatD n=1 Tax=Geminocystis sp. NIES-3709 TaxID=1617448 RepID=UPI0005FCDBDD|nr:heterocyst frequency control protein PatD [Geminocystis sp. NIES-3709]BAQ65007.1 hypothetical protein GM3709_1772 [Geminocystis sp. NIES-3709]